MNPLVFSFDTPEERLASARWRWVVLPVRGIAAGLIGLFGLFVLIVHLLIGRFTPLAIVGALLLVVGVGLLVVWRLRNRQSVAGRGRTKVVLDDRGIATHTKSGTTALAWERFERWQEDDDDFVAVSRVDKARGVVLVPKQDMDEPTQEEVRMLLDERIDPHAEALEDAFVEDDDDNDDAGAGTGA
ncbi:hypothetical protein GCM10027418_12640 [Mariniluteicoccus endophyticus]